jgi:glycosyltransferase involved in cell wall biosynthesis
LIPAPLVSIGIPTYNRPDGLLRTLQQITAQTYRNLEIVVSNNASTNPMVAALLARCAELDSRIRVINQTENVGILKNFQFVLNNTRADYFMWAADDDEWDPRFIATCVENMLTHDVGTVMPGFMRHNRALGAKGQANLPKMTGGDRYADVLAFYRTTPHSIFYGLHKRSTVAWFGNADGDAADDEYFLVRQMLDHGILTLPEVVLYTAGINDAKYQIKLPKEAEDRYFFQGRRLLNFARLILDSTVLTDLQKLELMQKVVLTKLSFVLNFESELRRPDQLALTRLIYVFIAQIDVNNLGAYASLVAQANAALKTRADQRPEAVAA